MEKLSELGSNIKQHVCQNKVISVIILVVVLVACGLCWYFLYWTKTPAYSLQIIRKSMEQHDLTTFNKHVDTQAVYSKLFDDYMAYSMKEDGMTNALAVGYAMSLKPMVVNALVTTTNEAISSGTNVENNSGDTSSNNFLQKTGAAKAKFVDIEDTTRSGNDAVISLKFNDSQVGKDFIIKLKMVRLDDGTWKVVAIDNFTEYITAYEQAKKDKLTELNKPIQDKINALVQIDENVQPTIDTNVVFGWKDSVLSAPITIQNKSQDTSITNMKVHIQVLDDKGAILLNTVEQINNAIPAGQKASLMYRHKLNPFIENEQKIASLGEKAKVKFSTQEVDTANEKIVLLTELPKDQ